MEKCSTGTGVVLEFEKAAMKGEPMPDGLSLMDQAMFQALAALYARYRRGELDRRQASAEKGKLLYEYEKQCRVAKFYADLAAWHTELRTRIEASASAYRKERTLENADALSATINGGQGLFPPAWGEEGAGKMKEDQP